MSSVAKIECEPAAQAWVVAPYRVIYGDTDAMGVVYHGNYMRYFEVGRDAYFRACGARYRDVEAQGLQMPVTELWARYRAPARYDDELAIATRVERITGARVRFGYRLTRGAGGLLLCEGVTVHGCVNRATGRPARVPQALAATLLRPCVAGA